MTDPTAECGLGGRASSPAPLQCGTRTSQFDPPQPGFRLFDPYRTCQLILLGLAFYYYPFAKYWVGGDVDAMACLGEIRATGRFTSWQGGFYFTSALIGAATRLIDWFGGPVDDYLLSYQVIILVSVLGIVALCFALIYLRTRSVSTAAAVSLLLGLTPGIVRLVAAYEDNIPTSLVHMQLVAVYSGFVWVHRDGPERRRWLKPLLAFALPLSLALALIAHRQLNVTIITPLLLYYFLRHMPPRRRLWVIARTYLVFAVVLAAAFAQFSRALSGGFHWSNYWETIWFWFVPCDYYKDFYFFNKFGWNLGRQALEILTGWSRLAGEGPVDFIVVFGLLACLAGLAGHSCRVGCSCREWLRALSDYDLILILFILIHIPHSLIYESSSLERWDVIVPPLAVLGGVWIQRARERGRARWFGRERSVTLPIFVVLLAFAWHHVDYYQRLNEISYYGDLDSRYWKLHTVRRLNDFHHLHQPQKKVVVIFPDVPDKVVMIRWLMVAETQFNYHDEIFFIGDQTGIQQPYQAYYALRPVNPATFRRLVKGAVILADGVLGEKLLVLAPGEQILLF